MNSHSIQKKYSEIYKDFFAKCEIVCSSPLVINWGTDYCALNGAYNITQKLPLRIYIGLEPKNSRAEENIFDCQIFLPEKHKFISYYFDSEQEKRMIAALNHLNLPIEEYRIHILSEYHYARGIQGYGPLALSLITAFFLAADKIKTHEFAKLKNLINFEFKKAKTETANQTTGLIDAAYVFLTSIEGFLSSELGLLTSLFDGEEFFLLLQDKINPTIRYSPEYSLKNIGDYITNLNYSVISFNKFFQYEYSRLPFDYLIMYNGLDKNYEDYFHPLNKIRRDLEQTANTFNKYNKIIGSNPTESEVIKMIKTKKSANLLNFYRQSAELVNLEIFKNLLLLIDNKLPALKDLFIDFKRTRNIMEVFKDIDPAAISLCNNIDNWDKGKGQLNICAKPLYLNDILVLGDKMKLRLEIEDLKKHLEALGFGAEFFYQSWEDGFGFEGLKIEQLAAEKIYSSFFDIGKINCVEFYQGKKQIYKYNLQTIEKLKDEADIILDKIANRIYLKGTILLSKDIHSSKKAIMLLETLLNKKIISPQDLDLGSYADRNELQSKIISPLQKSAQKYLKQKLDIKVFGSIAKNYQITFNPGLLKIIIINE